MHSFESLIAYLTFTKCSTVFFTQVNRIMKFMPASKTFNIKIAYSFYVAWKRLVVYFYWLPHSVNITTTVAAHIQAIFTFLLKTHMKIMLWSVNVDAWHWVLACEIWKKSGITEAFGVKRNRPHLIPGSLIHFLHQRIVTVGVWCLFVYTP